MPIRIRSYSAEYKADLIPASTKWILEMQIDFTLFYIMLNLHSWKRKKNHGQNKGTKMENQQETFQKLWFRILWFVKYWWDGWGDIILAQIPLEMKVHVSSCWNIWSNFSWSELVWKTWSGKITIWIFIIMHHFTLMGLQMVFLSVKLWRWKLAN